MTEKYQCFYLDPQYKLCHFEDSEPLLETDDLAEACTFMHNKFQEEGKDICIWQPRTQGYRGHCQQPRRDKKGRFI